MAYQQFGLTFVPARVQIVPVQVQLYPAPVYSNQTIYTIPMHVDPYPRRQYVETHITSQVPSYTTVPIRFTCEWCNRVSKPVEHYGKTYCYVCNHQLTSITFN